MFGAFTGMIGRNTAGLYASKTTRVTKVRCVLSYLGLCWVFSFQSPVIVIARQRIEAVAHHEAGHAVVAWAQELKFKRVAIEPEDDSLGYVAHGPLPKWFQPDLELSDRVRLRAERHIVMDFAEQLAEARFRERRPRYGMGADNQSALDMAFRLGGSAETVEAYLRYCWCRSNDLVIMRWREIVAVAAALVAHRTLSYDDVMEVVWPGSRALRERLSRRAGLPKG